MYMSMLRVPISVYLCYYTALRKQKGMLRRLLHGVNLSGLLMRYVCVCVNVIPSDSGMEMMTPFPVPTHSRLQDTTRAVILTNEKPSLPVPATHRARAVSIHLKIWRKEFSIYLIYTDAALKILSGYYTCTCAQKQSHTQ